MRLRRKSLDAFVLGIRPKFADNRNAISEGWDAVVLAHHVVANVLTKTKWACAAWAAVGAPRSAFAPSAALARDRLVQTLAFSRFIAFQVSDCRYHARPHREAFRLALGEERIGALGRNEAGLFAIFLDQHVCGAPNVEGVHGGSIADRRRSPSARPLSSRPVPR